MALAAAIIFEFRTTGSDDNGGGFKTGASGTDYSQQNAAQLTLTDLAMATGGTTLTSVTGGFTAAMIGNVIYIKSGTHFTAGWYEITARADTNTVTIDRDATDGTNGSAGTGSVGGARALPTDAFFEALTAGNTVYIKNTGTYTLTESIDVANDGTATNYIKIYGYNNTRGDAPTGNNQPYIACGAYTFKFDNCYKIKNLKLSGTTSLFFRADTGAVISNCDAINNSGSASRICLETQGDYSFIYDCKLCSINGTAAYLYNSHIQDCYLHTSVKGILLTSTSFVLNCIFDNCSTSGIENYSASRIHWGIINCTFFRCGTGINLGTTNYAKVFNNIFNVCATGMSATANLDCYNIDYNNFFGNTTADVTNVTKGANDTACDPEFEFVGVLGTDDSGVANKTTSMVDTSENFTTLGVTVGDTIINKTDGSWGTITSISTTTNANDTVNFSGGLVGGTDNDFDNGDTYSILGNFALKTTSGCIDAGFSIRLGVD